MSDSSYGVVYRPESVGYVAPDIDALQRANIQFVRIQWTDLINKTRFRVVPFQYFKKLLGSARPGVSVTKCNLGLVGIIAAPGFSPSGEYLYHIDLDSLRLCPYAPGHASVLGWFQYQIPSPNDTSLYVDICPRSILTKLVADARGLGISFLAGFETEFILLKSTDPIQPISFHEWSSSSALLTGSITSVVLEEIASALRKADIELQMYHAEGAPGQFEVVTGPLNPLEAADSLVFTRETISNIANKYGLRATLAPRVFGNSCGSAAHAHVSIHSTVEGVSSSLAPSLKSYEASFLQSLLDNLPAICAFSLPTVASYSRMVDGVWSGGTYVNWGSDNRESPIRLTGPPHSRNFEVRCVDGTCSPYLFLAGVAAAGIEGIKVKRRLEVADCTEIAAHLSVEERKALGIGENRLPLTLDEARSALVNNSTMKRYFGDNFISKFVSVNQTLQKHLSAETPDLEMKKVVEFY